MKSDEARKKILDLCKGYESTLNSGDTWVLYFDCKCEANYSADVPCLDEADILGMSQNKEELELQLTYLKMALEPEEFKYVELATLDDFIISVCDYMVQRKNEEHHEEIEAAKEEAKDEAYEEGHGEGYDEGYSEGYDKGHNEGYDKGYDEGYQARDEELEDEEE